MADPLEQRVNDKPEVDVETWRKISKCDFKEIGTLEIDKMTFFNTQEKDVIRTICPVI